MLSESAGILKTGFNAFSIARYETFSGESAGQEVCLPARRERKAERALQSARRTSPPQMPSAVALAPAGELVALQTLIINSLCGRRLYALYSGRLLFSMIWNGPHIRDHTYAAWKRLYINVVATASD